MLVDPNTGMPIDQGGSVDGLSVMMGAQNRTVGAVSGFAEEAGLVAPSPILDQLNKTVPGPVKSTFWNTYRGSRTIGYGAPGINQISGFRATFSPRFLRNLPSQSALGGRSTKTANYAFRASKYRPAPPGGLVASESYTPFNMLTKFVGNPIVNGRFGLGTMSQKGIEKMANAKSISMQEARDMANKSKLGRFQLRMADYTNEGPAFSIGTLSRVTAADKMARGKMPGSNVMNFLGETDKGLLDSFRSMSSGVQFNEKALRFQELKTGKMIKTDDALARISAVNPTSDEAARLTYASVDGAISGRVSGFMGQLRLGSEGMGIVDEAASRSGNKAYTAGREAAERFMKSGGFEKKAGQFVVREGSEQLFQKAGLKVGEKVTFNAARKIGGKAGLKVGARLATAAALQAVPVVGQIVGAVMLADLAMDVGKLGVEVFKSGVDFAKEAAISYKGSINKGVMGMGYRDNTVAATSRARGVQAIQNSRLNARSVLGSEAGAMHAHFG